MLQPWALQGTALAQMDIQELESLSVVAGELPWFHFRATWNFLQHPWGFQGGMSKMVAVQYASAKPMAI